jgi:ribosomal protein L19
MEIIGSFIKKTSEVSGFNRQQVSVVGNMFFSAVSDFYPDDRIEEKARWYDIELARFDQRVAFRKEYLDMLPSLGENWISGNSILPSRAVIEKSKRLLDEFNGYLARKKQQGAQIDVPKLVMGPIPSGGIGIEFHVNSENALYVSILNNNTAEIELKRFDFYSAIEPADLNRGVVADYELLASTNRNSGWGNSLSIL